MSNVDKTHAKLVGTTFQYPTQDEFPNVINWMRNDDLMRSKGYYPLVPSPGETDGDPLVYEFITQSATRTVSEQVWDRRDPEHKRKPHWERKTRTVDTSYFDVSEYEQITPPAPPAPVVVYSKYKLKQACEEHNLWEDVKALIENAGKWESFLLIQDIASDNAELLEVMPVIEQTFPAEVIADVLEKARI